MLVPIIYASESDKSYVKAIIEELNSLEIPYKEHHASAHKVPEKVIRIIEQYNSMQEVICFITIAGRSNGLSGMVASSIAYPVIACPSFKDTSDYLVNIHSSLQMPSETPVMTVVDPHNAALAAANILALTSLDLRKRLEEKIKTKKTSFNS